MPNPDVEKRAEKLMAKFEPMFQYSSIKMMVYKELAKHVEKLIIEARISQMKDWIIRADHPAWKYKQDVIKALRTQLSALEEKV